MSAAAPPPPRKARARRLSCPGCGGSIEVRANGISISAICASCGRTIDVASDDLRVIAEGKRNTRTLAIPIGTRGTLAGTEWEVVGYQARSNPEEGWTWDEYLLFNPYRGFRFLAHDDEGWTLYCMLRQDVPDPAHVEGDRHRYQGPDASEARTDYVLGEFYWRVRVGDTAHIEQYEAGSSLLVKEVTGDEIIWSRGFKVPTDQIRTAFKLAPEPKAAASHSPRSQTITVLILGITACIFLIVLQLAFQDVTEEYQAFYQKFELTASDRGRTMTSAPFTLPDRSTNAELDLYAPVDNDWVSLNISLVGEGGSPVFDAASTVEYYNGYDSDGSWEEGAQQSQILFRSVPGGTYRLLVEADAGAFDATAPQTFGDLTGLPQTLLPVDTRVVRFSITVKRHVPAPELFWLSLLLIVPYPVYRLLFKRGKT